MGQQLQTWWRVNFLFVTEVIRQEAVPGRKRVNCLFATLLAWLNIEVIRQEAVPGRTVKVESQTYPTTVRVNGKGKLSVVETIDLCSLSYFRWTHPRSECTVWWAYFVAVFRPRLAI